MTQAPERQGVHRPGRVRARQVCKIPTAADRASSSARHDVGATIGRTTNFEKPTPMNFSMTARRAGRPTGVSSTEREKASIEILKKAGIEINEVADKKQFQAAVKPVWDKYGAQHAALIERIQGVK